MNASLLWTQAMREAMASAPSNLVILHTLELFHPEFPTVRMVQNMEGFDLELETGETFWFEPASFQFTLPPTGSNGLQELSLQLDNVDERISQHIEAVMGNPVAITVKYRAYLSNDLHTPQMEAPLVLFLSDLRITAAEITGRASFADIINRRFLSRTYHVREFPGLA